MHPDVVAGDVRLGVGGSLGQRLQGRAAGPQCESQREPRRRPLPARPARPLRHHLVEVGQREVEQRHERQLRGEEVLGEVRAHIERGEELIDVELRPQFELAPALQGAADLEHVPVHLLQRRRESLQERLGVRRERLEREALQRRRIAVLGAPVGRHLPHAALGAGASRLAELLRQRGDDRGLIDGRRLLCGGHGRLLGGRRPLSGGRRVGGGRLLGGCGGLASRENDDGDECVGFHGRALLALFVR